MGTTTLGKLIRKALAVTGLAVGATLISALPAHATNIYPCMAENTTDYAIVDISSVTSGITMPANCTGPMSTGAVVDVVQSRQYRGFGGCCWSSPTAVTRRCTAIPVGNGTRIYAQYSVTLSAPAQTIGHWHLYVYDKNLGNTGVIDSWKLTLHTANLNTSCIKTVTTPVTLEDGDGTNVSAGGCSGKAGKLSTVELSNYHPVHGLDTYEMFLFAPDGTRYMLRERGVDNWVGSRVYTLDLCTENANGTWRVEIYGYGATLSINKISLNLNSTSYGPLVVDQKASVQTVFNTTVSGPMSINQGGSGSVWATVDLYSPDDTRLWNFTIELVSPDGSRYLVHKGGLTQYQTKTVRLNLTAERRFGTWKLDVYSIVSYGAAPRLDWTMTM